MARRLYLGRLPTDARTEDVQKLFDGFGKIVDCRVMTGFGFVEFESSRDAEDAVHQFNGKSFMGSSIVVEFAKESRPRREPYDSDRAYAPRARRPGGVRLLVQGISRDTSWQDLKDFGREAGSVSFADIDRDVPGQGVLEYLAREDAEQAVKTLDGRELRGQSVQVSLAGDRNGPDNYRRDDRARYDRYRDDRYRDDRYRDDRYRDDRRRDDHYRDDRDNKYRDAPRRRSTSPPPRSGRDERARSPKRDYDDRRSGREGGREDRGADFDRRKDDRKRDDRDRGEERSSRQSNGDGNWSR